MFIVSGLLLICFMVNYDSDKDLNIFLSLPNEATPLTLRNNLTTMQVSLRGPKEFLCTRVINTALRVAFHYRYNIYYYPPLFLCFMMK